MSSPCALAHAQTQPVCAEGRASFVVTPNQSLSDHGAYALYTVLAGAIAVIQAPFLAKGYWPITIFSVIGLVGAMIGIHCFRFSQRVRREEIVVAEGTVSVRRWAFRSPVREMEFHCYGLKLIRSDDPDFGCLRLALAVREQREEIARDLSPSERKSLADALMAALRPYSVPLRIEVALGWAFFTKGPYAP